MYANYRPAYPKELFDFIFIHIKNKGAAWDCATGNGQTAKELASYFEKVLATDISQKQLDNAFKADNIFYSVQPAEQTNFADDTIDLVTVSQALHWLDFDKFYTEVRRVGKPGSWIAVWVYSLLRISPEINEIMATYHFDTLEKYWDNERKFVDDNYTTVPFPFEEIKTPPFIAANNYNPVPELIKTIQPSWKGEKMKITFPLHMRMGKTGK